MASSSDKHSAALIFLHGLGDTGSGWRQILSEICPKHVKVICPNAPTQAVSLNFGAYMPSWFDIKSLTVHSDEDEKGILKSSVSLKNYIEEEVKKGLPYERIVIGGFSQGGSVGLHAFITHEKKLAGCVGLSTWLPLNKKFDSIKRAENKETKVFLGHGKSDPIVRCEFGVMTNEKMKKHYSNIQWKTYDGLDHSSNPAEMKDVKKFIESVLPETS